MESTRLRRVVALGAAVLVAVAMSAGCSGDKDKGGDTGGGDAGQTEATKTEEAKVPPYTTGAFGELSESDDVVWPENKDYVPIDDAEGATEKWRTAGEDALNNENAAGLYKDRDNLFMTSDGELTPMNSSITFVKPEMKAGGTFTLNVGCFAAKGGVPLLVTYQQRGVEKYMTAELACGDNKLAEGTIVFEMPANEGVVIDFKAPASEGYSLYGLHLDGASE
ncbi:MAG: hypothetical protein Q4G30_10415 [Actinomycetaceae bacterium]|nr:hypothetical protein [Actinomycetaceae bacterium]